MNQSSDKFTRLRERMVKNQLLARGIRDPRVLNAMRSVPREEFMPRPLRHKAYNDGAAPIGDGQTISQPYTVAYMAELAELGGDEKILEVGTGSGYGAAVLSELCAEVHTIERIPTLAEQATAKLQNLGYSNVSVHTGDGSLGLIEHAPFSAILVSAGAAYLPPAYEEQLCEGGRIVIPIGSFETSQHLYRYRRSQHELEMEDHGKFAFVPLIGDEGWHPSN